MIRIAPVGVHSATTLAELASRPDVVAFGDHRAETPVAAWTRWVGPPDPHLGLAIGAFEGTRLRAALRVILRSSRRRMHGATLELLASTDAQADAAIDALLAAAIDACDRWLQVVRCELRCPADHPRIGGLFAARGFALEARLRAAVRTNAGFRDEALLGRIREGVEPPEPLATTLRIPKKQDTRPARVTIRPARSGDGRALARMMGEPTVVWGTLQLPFQRAERWEERLGTKQSRLVFLIGEVDGELAGTGALTVFDEPRRTHAGTIGMQVATGFQGRGVGTRILASLLEHADRRGLTRVELSVYPDNDRARRLYERAGFEHEGRCRLGSFRDGTWVDELMMGRVRA